MKKYAENHGKRGHGKWKELTFSADIKGIQKATLNQFKIRNNLNTIHDIAKLSGYSWSTVKDWTIKNSMTVEQLYNLGYEE